MCLTRPRLISCAGGVRPQSSWTARIRIDPESDGRRFVRICISRSVREEEVRNIDIGQGLAIIANLGVVAGIVLLAYELNQNNSLLRAQASYSLLLNRTESRNSLVNASEEVADFWLRVSSNAPLTATDELRLTAWVEMTFLKWQYEYGQFLDGNLSEAELPLEGYRAAFRGEGFANIRIFPEVWRSLRAQLRPDFVRWIETNVVSQ
jgi:hypothetical protein